MREISRAKLVEMVNGPALLQPVIDPESGIWNFTTRTRDLRGDSSSRFDNKSEADAVFFFLARVPRAAGATAPTTAFFTVLFFFIGTTTGEKGSLEVLAMGDWIASKRLAGDTQLDYGGARVFICVLYIVPCFQEKIHFNTLI